MNAVFDSIVHLSAFAKFLLYNKQYYDMISKIMEIVIIARAHCTFISIKQQKIKNLDEQRKILPTKEPLDCLHHLRHYLYICVTYVNF